MVNTSLLAGATLKCDAGSVVMSFLDKMTMRNPALGNTSPMLPVRLVLPPALQAWKVIDLCPSFQAIVHVKRFYGYTMKTNEREKGKKSGIIVFFL